MWRLRWWPYTNFVANSAMDFPSGVRVCVSHIGRKAVLVDHNIRNLHNPLRTSGTVMSGIADVAHVMGVEEGVV
jgi:hypothetical protein